jgi:hypothetical protein
MPLGWPTGGNMMMTGLGELCLAQTHGDPPTTPAAGRAPAERSVSILRAPFRGGAHLSAKTNRHFIPHGCRASRHEAPAGSLGVSQPCDCNGRSNVFVTGDRAWPKSRCAPAAPTSHPSRRVQTQPTRFDIGNGSKPASSLAAPFPTDAPTSSPAEAWSAPRKANGRDVDRLIKAKRRYDLDNIFCSAIPLPLSQRPMAAA